jgi:hypothetical protein
MLGKRVFENVSSTTLDLRDGPGSASNSLLAALAVPDTDSSALDSVLAAECANVSGVLCDFHLLHLLSERGTVSVQLCQSSGIR